jgi:lipopolysaccharide/colanic/teichoic acid biosynthesis glycosyltransferase
MTKRIFDILLSLVAFIVFFIPVFAILISILIFEKHPLIFYQERIGLNKKPFRILKFQTLVNNIPTKTGKFLRKTGLDELPQFVNVFKGEMSIVGPRALTNFDIERLKWDAEYHKIRWNCKPGITGYAQIFGGQHKKTSWFWDIKYMKTHNLFKDFAVIVISFLMNIFGKPRVRRMIWPDKNLK